MAAPAAAASEVIRILVSTDNHVGYLERDPLRGDDSFDTFEEVLQIAEEQKVDMVLLCGDLFHDNKPSRKCLHRVMEILNRHVFGDREVDIAVVSDQQVNFRGAGQRQMVNYEDPNVNVQLPVFSIHGNHDDPVGEGALASLDLLSSANLVNYFGRSDNVDSIQVHPVCVQKGGTKLALYGLGHIRDQRLHRTFESGKVQFLKPAVDTDQWFNIAVVHQNRHRHAHKDYLDENFLDAMMDVCIWGHEHECLIGGGMQGLPETLQSGIIIMQPGSTVATSVIHGEAKRKHVALLEVKEQKWKMTPIPLKSVRPMLVHDIKLSEVHAHIGSTTPDDVMKHLEEWVSKMVSECEKELEERGVDLTNPVFKKLLQPIVRVNIETGKLSTPFHPQQFGQRFVGKVANPNDLVHLRKGRASDGPSRVARDEDSGIGSIAAPSVELNAADITSYVVDILAKQSASKRLKVLPAQGMTDAVANFAVKDEKHAIEEFVKSRLKQVQELLLDQDKPLAEHDANHVIADALGEAEPSEQQSQISDLRKEIDHAIENDDVVLEGVAMEDEAPAPAPSPKAKGGRKKAAPKAAPKAAAKGTKRSREQPVVVVDDDESDDDDDEAYEEPQPVKRRRKEPAPAKPRARAAASRQTTLKTPSQPQSSAPSRPSPRSSARATPPPVVSEVDSQGSQASVLPSFLMSQSSQGSASSHASSRASSRRWGSRK